MILSVCLCVCVSVRMLRFLQAPQMEYTSPIGRFQQESMPQYSGLSPYQTEPPAPMNMHTARSVLALSDKEQHALGREKAGNLPRIAPGVL